MVNILIVEDEKPISDLIKLSLKGAGYLCHCVYDGEAAADLLEENSFDLILLDIMIPHIDGFELLEYIKPLNIPVIFMTAMNSVSDRVKGLKMGAEDYIIKPFDVAELLARVEVVLRRFHKASDIIHVGADLTIDLKKHIVTSDGREVALTPKEYDLLVLFAQNPNVALYRETIYERVWGGSMEDTSKTVDLHVQRLRKKAHLERVIKTVHKVGYRLEMKT